MLEVSTWSFNAGGAGHRLLEPDFLPPRLTGLFATSSYETYFRSCYKMSICKGAPPHFLSVQEFHEQRVCGTTDKKKKERWLNSMACSFL